MDSYSDIQAQIHFFDSDKGGRNVPFGQGFSPKLKFDSSPFEFFTLLDIEETDTIFPGDQLKLTLRIKGEPGIHLHKGASFDLIEGENTIGSGTVMQTL